MSALLHFPYPHAGRWAVVYAVPGTSTLQVVCTCRSFAACHQECERLNGGRA